MANSPVAANTTSPPMKTKSIVDFAWGLSLFFSHDEREKQYGDDMKNKWKEITERYKNDIKATCYLDNVYAAISGTVYSLAYLRNQVTNQFAFLEDLKKRRINDLDDLASLSAKLDSVAVRVVGLSIGGGTFLQFAANSIGAKEVAFMVIGAAIGYFGLEIILRIYKNLNAPRILRYIQSEKENYLAKQFEPKSQKFLEDLLKKVDDISKDVYGQEAAIDPAVITQLSASSASLHSSFFITGSGAISPYTVPSTANPAQRNAGSMP
ncbi:MAG: hypothetical protein NWE94_06845 [Candidatus Bathyarchaeota archaeon]|nr:hypothetical protein [Candidatus Bathyarchaeota archaeon]